MIPWRLANESGSAIWERRGRIREKTGNRTKEETMNRILQCATFATAMLVASSAFARPALVTTDLNLRRGPGTGYRVITAMPNGAIVDVHGCVRGYRWCRVD
jgi:uncharacterized protein YraI